MTAVADRTPSSPLLPRHSVTLALPPSPSDSLKQYTSAAFDSLKADLRERNVALPGAPKGFNPVPQAAGLV